MNTQSVWCLGRRLVLLGATVLLFGCASAGNPRDPLEPFNRAIFGINDGLDQIALKPLADGYRTIVPSLARASVTNFFSNLEDLWIAINDILQGKPRKGLDDWTRFFINTTVGILGLYDIATDIGLEKRNEDFGQTLGRWGIGSGPYLVLPILGPSTARDALGLALVDVHADVVRQQRKVVPRNTLYALRAVNLRANLLDATRIVEEASLDKYTFTRDAYLQRRRSLVYDGDPPRDDRASLEHPGEDGPDVASVSREADPADSGTLAPAATVPLAGLPAATSR